MTRLKHFYWFVVALHLGLLWWLPFFPSQDGACHVYNTVILRDLMNGGMAYGQFFDLELFFTPNLGAAVPLYLLTAFLPPVMAEKVFLSLFIVLLAGVMPLLARLAGNAAYPASFVIFPLLFSRMTMPGFYSFMLGVPLWLWAMWLFWQMRDRPLWQRLLAGNGCALVLFACHLLPFACYVLSIGCALVVMSLTRKNFVARWREALALLALPLLLLAGYGWSLGQALAQNSGGLSRPSGPIGLLSGLNVSQNLGVLLNLLTFAQITFSARQISSGLLLGLLLFWFLGRRETRQRWRAASASNPCEENELAARRWLLLIGLGLFVAMLFVPDRLGELSLVKVRFVPLIALLFIPLLPCALLPQSLPRLLLAASLALALLNGALLARAAQQVNTYVTALPAAAVRGQFVAGYRGIPASKALINPLLHATSYYCAQHGCVDIGNYQAHSQQFFVRFKPRPTLAVFRQIEAAPTKIAWEHYPDLTYLLGWEFDSQEKARLAPTFTMLDEKGALSLWRRSQTAPTTAPATAAALTQ